MGPIAAIIGDERAYKALQAGIDPLYAGAVAIPLEDVFAYDPGVGPGTNQPKPFDAWNTLTPLGL